MSEKHVRPESLRLSKQLKKIASGVSVVLAGAGGLALYKSNGSSSKTAVRPTPTTLEVPKTTSATTLETTTSTEKNRLDEIDMWKIVGSPEAQKDIRDALRIIKGAKDQTYWQIVDKFHPTFVADAVEFGVFPTIKTVKISDQERNYIGTNTGIPEQDKINKKNNLDWLAGSEVHECLQGVFFMEGKPWSGANAENIALYVQGRFLTDIGADSNMINFVNNAIDLTNSPASYWNRYKNGQIQPYK